MELPAVVDSLIGGEPYHTGAVGIPNEWDTSHVLIVAGILERTSPGFYWVPGMIPAVTDGLVMRDEEGFVVLQKTGVIRPGAHGGEYIPFDEPAPYHERSSQTYPLPVPFPGIIDLLVTDDGRVFFAQEQRNPFPAIFPNL